jgi:hypothetical protein
MLHSLIGFIHLDAQCTPFCLGFYLKNAAPSSCFLAFIISTALFWSHNKRTFFGDFSKFFENSWCSPLLFLYNTYIHSHGNPKPANNRGL